MPKRERDEHGQIKELDPETVLEVFEARDDPCEPLDAGDVADGLGWARRTALKKLDELSEAGVLADKKVGARGRVWWVPGDHSVDADAVVPERDVDGLIAEVGVPGSGAKAAKRRDAVRAAYDRLRAEGSVSSEELRETAWGAIGDPHYDDAHSLWNNCVYPALSELPGTDSGGEGSHSWTYVGDEDTADTSSD